MAPGGSLDVPGDRGAGVSFAPAPFTLRAAELRDVSAIVQMIRDLAEFEKLAHLVQVTPEKLRPQLFGEKPAVEAMVADGYAQKISAQ